MDFKLTFCYYIIESLHLQKTHSGTVIAIYDINCQQWIHILLKRESFLKIYFDKTHCWQNKDTGGKTISCRKIFMHSRAYAVLVPTKWEWEEMKIWSTETTTICIDFHKTRFLFILKARVCNNHGLTFQPLKGYFCLDRIDASSFHISEPVSCRSIQFFYSSYDFDFLGGRIACIVFVYLLILSHRNNLILKQDACGGKIHPHQWRQILFLFIYLFFSLYKFPFLGHFQAVW